MTRMVVPADVPKEKEADFIAHYDMITKKSDHLFLFSCDQKIEHLHDDFNPDDNEIADDTINPEHLFQIANQGRIGAMATQLELIARYGKQFPKIPYIAKLNSTTNLVPTSQKEPESAPLWHVEDVIRIAKDGALTIAGVGVTIYLGSEFESEMLSFATDAICEAHKEGLLAIVWMYPRGKAVKNETDAHLLAGAAGAANALGADFVKIKPPAPQETKTSAELLKPIVAAAGNTHVLCTGGAKTDPQAMLQTLHDQLHIGGIAGTATGRNVFQYALSDAIAMTNALSALVYDNASTQKAVELIKGLAS